jgi:ligand-binding sensor domain-containing protein
MRKILFLLIAFCSHALHSQITVKLLDSITIGLPENDLQAVDADENGKVYIGTSNSGLIEFKDTIQGIFNPKNSVIKGNYIGPVFIDKDNNVWASYSNPDKLVMFNGSKWTEIKDSLLNDFGVTAITQDTEGNLYFGGSGLLKYNQKTWSKINLPVGATIRALDISNDGTIAIGHNDGLIIGKEGNWKTYTEENSELVLDVVRAVKFTPENKLLIGYGGGFGDGGFSVLSSGMWQHYNKSNSKISDHMVRDIEYDGKSIYWMATNDGLVRFENGVVVITYFFNDGQYSNVIKDIVYPAIRCGWQQILV